MAAIWEQWKIQSIPDAGQWTIIKKVSIQDNWGGCQIEEKISESASSFRIRNFSDRKAVLDACKRGAWVELKGDAGQQAHVQKGEQASD